ncbi:hypothetical protein ACNKHX_11680 [Shigella flexneri]
MIVSPDAGVNHVISGGSDKAMTFRIHKRTLRSMLAAKAISAGAPRSDKAMTPHPQTHTMLDVWAASW